MAPGVTTFDFASERGQKHTQERQSYSGKQKSTASDSLVACPFENLSEEKSECILSAVSQDEILKHAYQDGRSEVMLAHIDSRRL